MQSRPPERIAKTKERMEIHISTLPISNVSLLPVFGKPRSIQLPRALTMPRIARIRMTSISIWIPELTCSICAAPIRSSIQLSMCSIRTFIPNSPLTTVKTRARVAILVRMYLYRAVDRDGKTLDFMLSEKRDTSAATKFFASALANNGIPKRIVIDKSRANGAGIKEVNKILKRFGCPTKIKPVCSKYWSSPGLMDTFSLMKESVFYAENEEPVPSGI